MKKLTLFLLAGLFLAACQPKTETVVIKGEKGDRGEKGESGQNGLSAYEIAVKNGFAGSEADWLLSLIGAKGDSGTNGTNGKSAFEVWQEIPGNETKTLTEFIDSLKGPIGPQGLPGQSCAVSSDAQGALVTCGSSGSVLIKHGTNGLTPIVTTTSASAASCPSGGVVITVNGVSNTTCFNGTSSSVSVSGDTRAVLLAPSCPGSVEYGLIIGTKLYAVYHKELTNGDSNTYLAQLAAGSYATTDGSNCYFAVNYGNGTIAIGTTVYHVSSGRATICKKGNNDNSSLYSPDDHKCKKDDTLVQQGWN